MSTISVMRVLPVTSLGVLSAAALLIPLAPPAAALSGSAAGDSARSALSSAASATSAASAADPAAARSAGQHPRVEGGAPGARLAAPQLPGSTQSLRLRPLHPASSSGAPGEPRSGDADRGAGPSARTVAELGLAPRTVRPFSLLGLIWNDARDQLHGRAQVRIRSAHTGAWSGWRTLDVHSTHAPDGARAERGRGSVRGAINPLWAGASDGVQLRVTPESGGTLPEGLRLELIDPGDGDAAAVPGDRSGADEPGGRAADGAGADRVEGDRAEADGAGRADSAERADAADTADADAAVGNQLARIPALSKAETEAAAGGGKHVGPRPGIVTRKGWGADEKLREDGYPYTRTVKAAFVHHTAMTNSYRCSQAPSIIRGIYRYHVKSSGWRDMGYNFLVDKCGTIYEGRAGGVVEPVQGAHTYGFNSNSMGVAVLGSFGKANPSRAAQDAVAKLTAWKLGLFGVNAKATTTLTSGGGKYAKGRAVRMNTISGHRDGFNTECPGARLYDKLGSIRATAARLQGR